MSGNGLIPPDLADFISDLPDDIRQWIEDLISGDLELDPSELRRLLISLLLAARNWETLTGILAWLARLGILDSEVVIQAITESAEIAVEAEAGAAAAPAAVAGISGAAVAAVLTTILVVIASGGAIAYELTRDLKLPTGGPPCGLETLDGREMATVLRTVQVDAWGARRSLNQAIEQAQQECNKLAAKCGHGKCPGGGNCVPTVAVESYEQDDFYAFTRTTLTFACPCGCL